MRKTAAALALAGLLAVLAGDRSALAVALRDGDCAKCHGGPAADLSLAGASHEEVSCSGCDEGHPPKSKVTVPACGECHSGNRHYDKPSCSSCHANPHMPLRVTMSSATSEPCRECHPAPVALIARGGSAHSEQGCADCHPAHRQTPDCAECHEPHALTETAPECTACHQAHLPIPVIYSFEVPDRECASCHPEAFDLLRADSTGHSRRSCVTCHKERHGTVLECATCHGLPHRISAEALFDDCNRCHRTAHDLEIWPGEKSSGSAEQNVPENLRPFLELGREELRQEQSTP